MLFCRRVRAAGTFEAGVEEPKLTEALSEFFLAGGRGGSTVG